MLRSFCNISKLFAARNFVHQHPRIVSPLLIQSSSFNRCLHSSVTLFRVSTVSKKAISSTNIPTVLITSFFPNRGKLPYYAIYWEDCVSLNTLKRHSIPGATLFHAVLKSMTLALQQAINQRKLDEVVIKIDSKCMIKVVNEYLKYWRKNGYTKKDGSSVKHKEEIEKMDQLLSMINAKVELLPKSVNNYVLCKLKEDAKYSEAVGKLISGVQAYDLKEAASKNVIFVCGAISEVPSKKAGYGVNFKNRFELNIQEKFDEFPVSRPRALMRGVIEALQKAKAKNLKDIQIVTDDAIFLKYFKNGWKKTDGSSVKNELFYERIKRLADELDVSFRFISENDDDLYYKNAKIMANIGMKMSTEKKGI